MISFTSRFQRAFCLLGNRLGESGSEMDRTHMRTFMDATIATWRPHASQQPPSELPCVEETPFFRREDPIEDKVFLTTWPAYDPTTQHILARKRSKFTPLKAELGVCEMFWQNSHIRNLQNTLLLFFIEVLSDRTSLDRWHRPLPH